MKVREGLNQTDTEKNVCSSLIQLLRLVRIEQYYEARQDVGRVERSGRDCIILWSKIWDSLEN